MSILRGDAEISSSLRVTISLFSGKSNGQWLEGCTFYGNLLFLFFLLNTIINPYYHSCGFMTDIYRTISLFSLPSPWNYNLFLRRIPNRSLWSHRRNPPLVNSRERQSFPASTIPQIFGHCTCSDLKCVECTNYVRIQGWTRACEQSVYVVCVPVWFIK